MPFPLSPGTIQLRWFQQPHRSMWNCLLLWHSLNAKATLLMQLGTHRGSHPGHVGHHLQCCEYRWAVMHAPTLSCPLGAWSSLMLPFIAVTGASCCLMGCCSIVLEVSVCCFQIQCMWGTAGRLYADLCQNLLVFWSMSSIWYNCWHHLKAEL